MNKLQEKWHQRILSVQKIAVPLLLLTWFLMLALFATREKVALHIGVVSLCFIDMIGLGIVNGFVEYFCNSKWARRSEAFSWFDNTWKAILATMIAAFVIMKLLVDRGQPYPFQSIDPLIIPVETLLLFLTIELTVRFCRYIDMKHDLPNIIWPERK
ncbi:MAG: hypothetical protein NT003_02560 [Candidatus Magasanikbacteria bacterium]|nr:hypothetical protein [Candidatus Magasanikbacteria bacterium]